jgi:hypothetical protein
MAKNYTISFKSLRTGNDYVVTIGGGTDGTVALKGAASPFVTEEGDDEDVFTPVRTQTGYIRIVDDGYGTQIINGTPTQVSFDWKDLIPLTDTARPVTLTQGGTVLWQGFMQSQNFGATLYGNPQEREYPIQCPLASAAGQDIVLATSPVTEMKNFAYYLKSILDYIVSVSNGVISFDYVYIQGGSTMQNNMLCLIDPQCFVELDKDENTISAKYNKYDVLEDICRYWGLTARVHGRSVYLCAPNADSTFIKMSMANLATMANGTAAGTSVNVQSVTIPNVFASINNDVTLQRGYSKATVKGDAGNADDEIIQCFPKYIVDHMTAAQSGDRWDAGGDKAFWYDRKATSIDGVDMAGTANGTSLFATGWVVDSFPFDFNSDTTNIVQCGGIYDGSVKVRIATKFEHNFQGLYFTLNAETIFAGYKMDFTSGDNEYGDKKMYVRLGIETTRGGTTTRKYFTGAGWSTTQTAIQMTIGNKGKTLYYINSMYGSDSYEKNIPVPFGAGYFGKLFVEFLGTDDPTATIAVISFYDFALTDFTIEMAYHSNLPLLPSKQDKTTYEFSAENDSACVEEWNADCIFCSLGSVKFGYGIYFAGDGSDQPNRQEATLANRVGGQTTGYWKSSKLMYRTELLANDQDVAGLTPQSEATIDNVACYPVSIGRDWRDDVAKVIFIQK